MPQSVGSTLWRFEPRGGGTVKILAGPSITGVRTEVRVSHGLTFEVSEEVAGPRGETYLKLMDGRGWLPDRLPMESDGCIGEQLYVRIAPPADFVASPDS